MTPDRLTNMVNGIEALLSPFAPDERAEILGRVYANELESLPLPRSLLQMHVATSLTPEEQRALQRVVDSAARLLVDVALHPTGRSVEAGPQLVQLADALQQARATLGAHCA